MKHIKKLLLQELRKREMRKFAEAHIRDIIVDLAKNEVKIFIDKRYVINLLRTHRYVRWFNQGIKNLFSRNIKITLRLKTPHHAHEREILIPFMIHY